MSAPISVVIPTLEAMAVIGPTLASLTPGLAGGQIKELIITDGGSTDEVERVAEELGALLITGAPGRGGQLRRGAEAARGDWFLFLHADTRLPDGWESAVERHIADAPDQAAVFRLSYDQRSLGARIVAGWANLRTRLLGAPYGDQALLISRRLYEEVGGFPNQPLMEDIEIMRAIGRRRFVMLNLAVETSFVRYAKEGWFRRGLKNWFLMTLYAWGVPIEKIAERYRR